MQTPLANRLTAGLTAGRRSVAGMVGRRLLAAALCLVVAGCSGGTSASTAPGQAAASPAPTPAQATDTQGQYRLVFELPQTDWRASDPITGEATLSLIGADAVDFGASGMGPLAFGFDEIDGNRHVGWTMTADCRNYHLDAGQSMSSPIKKSGTYSATAAPYDFNRWFMTDPLVHLQAGDWTITAIASLVDGSYCSGAYYTLKTTVVVHVTA
jgi:hypothetical protein